MWLALVFGPDFVTGRVRHVARPAEQTTAVVQFHSGDTEAPIELLRRDAETSGMLNGDLKHGSAGVLVGSWVSLFCL